MHSDLVARPTAMALAFIDAAAKGTVKGRQSVAKAAARNSGLKFDRGVDLKVSFRTAQLLKKDGVL